MNIFKSHPIGLITLGLMLLMVVLSSCTSQEERIMQYKNQAISQAWEQERKLVKLGHSGTRQWSEIEKLELLETSKVTGYEGRYINKYVEDNIQLATDSNNIFFAKVGESYPPNAALKSAALRSYLIQYEKNKYLLWAGTLATIIVLIAAFQNQRDIITYPAIIGAALGAIKLGIVSSGSIMAIIGGLVSGLIVGTMAGLFLFLIVLSVGVG
ncbi:conserved hypothetical protein, membrane [Candidatus Thiomargarita nelsonii]|uniref:Tox-GHH domain-containing protein n=1 Tax=Candidatus Thiomargarita nelsonii TaxID=1003181 RepID=A0A176S365_9GAMM|nr:conserved hypothetical protein, membrane [Candidatus Thiomargarita nelsonii]